MPGALPTLRLESSVKTELSASQLKASTAAKPPAESFKSKLAEASKGEKPKPAEAASARVKKSEKPTKAKSSKGVKKLKGDVETDETAENDVAAAKPAGDQGQPAPPDDPGAQADTAQNDDAKEKKDDAPAVTNTPTVDTPALVLAQQAAVKPPVAADTPTAATLTPKAPPTIELKAKLAPLPAKQQTVDPNSVPADSAARSADGNAPVAADSNAAPASDPNAPVSPLLKNPQGQKGEQADRASASNDAQQSSTDASANANSPTATFSDLLASFQNVQSFSDAEASTPMQSSNTKPVIGDDSAVSNATAAIGAQPASSTDSSTTAVRAANAPPTPQAAFNIENHPKIVQSVQTQLLPTGGTMRIRLDPPELGVLQVSVHVKNGITTASFETSNDQATKLLSHSMGQLKDALEAQGITVGKMHVQQSPRNQSGNNQESQDDHDRQPPQDDTAKQEQQRKEAMQRMWRRLSIGSDPLDMVA